MTEIELQQKFEQAKEAMHTQKPENIRKAQEVFLALGDYKNSASLAEKCEMLLTFQVGNTVTFGSWEGKPIRWRVCDSNGKLKLLIAEEIVLQKAYNDLRVDVYWQSSTLRKWLNKEFLQEAFTRDQRALVTAIRNSNEPNEQFFTNAGLPTMDKVFVLSKRELDKYLPAKEDRTLGQWWWIRTPGDNLLAVSAVDIEGSVYLHGVNVNYEPGGVRPAMWIFVREY